MSDLIAGVASTLIMAGVVACVLCAVALWGKWGKR